ncbi:MAG: cell division protein SepF [Oscillospiraceae bacterium]|jgi:cell division inhibitor SepF|nr:cell division protein SepF [Oscillospiraceae bacterium]
MAAWYDGARDFIGAFLDPQDGDNGDEYESFSAEPARNRSNISDTAVRDPIAPRKNNESRAVVRDMQVSTSMKVSWFRPTSYNQNGEITEIADQLREKRTVILNLEDVRKKEDSRRLLDFLAGVVYAQQGIVRKIAINAYLFGPYNIDFQGNDILTMMDEA